jgi:hypothetical protein
MISVKQSGKAFLRRAGRLNRPSQVLLTAIAKLQTDQMIETCQIPELLSEMIATYPRMRAEFTYRGREQDRLFDAESDHHGFENTCDTCVKSVD